jgi:hypothetical protein
MTKLCKKTYEKDEHKDYSWMGELIPCGVANDVGDHLAVFHFSYEHSTRLSTCLARPAQHTRLTAGSYGFANEIRW